MAQPLDKDQEATLQQMAEDFIYSDEAKLELEADADQLMSMYERGSLQAEDL